jgi:transposase
MTRTLTKKLACIKPGTLFIGIDLALKSNVAVVIDQQAARLDRFSFPNERDGFDFFRRRLRSHQERQQAPAVMVGMEPTNYFWKPLASDLAQHEIFYCLVNSYTVKKHREGDQLARAKDDARDAFTIADLVRTGKYTQTRLLQPPYADLRHYAVLRHRLVRDSSRQKILLQGAVGQLFPELSTVFSSFTGATALAMLRGHAAATQISQLPLETFLTRVRQDLKGPRLLVSRLRQAHALAPTSIGLQQGTQAIQLALRLHIESWEALQIQLEQVEKVLQDTFLATPESRYLVSIPGLGTVTAATILAEIGNPAHFTQARQLVKLAGVQPVPNLSGNKTRSLTPMSRQGRPRLRSALFFAVLRLIQSDDGFASAYQYYLQREKRPLTKMQAIGALMNKLLRVLWALMRHKTMYDPTRLIRA